MSRCFSFGPATILYTAQMSSGKDGSDDLEVMRRREILVA